VTPGPTPIPDECSARYWQATASGELALARCSRCQAFTHPPEVVCPTCHHPDPKYAFEPVARSGQIRSWTVVRQAFLPDLDVPFVLVDVELDGVPGVRLIGRLTDGPESQLHLGDRVHVVFDDTGGQAVPAFSLGEPW
jgi:uncharacterized OB-fold protein